MADIERRLAAARSGFDQLQSEDVSAPKCPREKTRTRVRIDLRVMLRSEK